MKSAFVPSVPATRRTRPERDGRPRQVEESAPVRSDLDGNWGVFGKCTKRPARTRADRLSEKFFPTFLAKLKAIFAYLIREESRCT